VLPAVVRRAVEPVQLAGYHLPAGTTVMPCIRLVHLSANHYPDPMRFRPERFLEGQGRGYAWIPFGGGTRRCIGASFASFQMRVVLRTILARAELSPDRPADERVKNQHVTFVPGRAARVIKSPRRSHACVR
jgi:cytochrome P450 family 135